MCPSSRGFSLIETIISIGVLAGVIATLAHLLAVCVETNAAAHHRTMSVLFAQQKLEQLRAEATLDDNPRVDEYLDADGTVVCRGPDVCGAAVYLRQWSVHVSEIAAPALFVHVRARRARRGGGEVNLITVRPRVLR
jgi:Tfp pilus assembly protein PilV